MSVVTFESQEPNWWLNRLIARMSVQNSIVTENEMWYTGRQPLPAASTSNSDLYRRFQNMSQTNLVAKVVDVASSRLAITGVRSGEQETDEHLWDLWQRSEMDSEQETLFSTALALGVSYISVWPDDEGIPTFYPEHPAQVVHVPVPGRPREVAAALKIFYDELTMFWTAVMYTPEYIYKWYSLSAFDAVGSYSADDVEIIPNPYGMIPIIPLRNRPTLTGWYYSEMRDAIPIQERINQTTLNMLVAQEAVAFPQRWATGLELDKDENGQAARPFKSSPDALWVAEDPEVKFGEFAESSFTAYLDSLRQDTEAIASVTNTPAFNLGSHLRVPPSAEALSAMESGLVKKIRQKQLQFGEAIEKAMRVAMVMEGKNPTDYESLEVIWSDPRVRSDAQVGDFAVKMQAVGVPREAIWAELGATPQMIARWNELAMAQTFRDLVSQVGMQQQQAAAIPPGEDEGDDDEVDTENDPTIQADARRPKKPGLPQGGAEPYPGAVDASQNLNAVAGIVT
jgi:Phage portal protein, SPP1 Gp6-like